MRRRSHSILIVDDDDVQMKIAVSRLKRFSLSEDSIGDFEITEARSSSEADEALKEKNFDLVLTDYNMPNGNGDVVARTVKQKGGSTPVVCSSVSTAYELEEMRQRKEGEDLLFSDVVDKVDGKSVIASVKKFLKKK